MSWIKEYKKFDRINDIKVINKSDEKLKYVITILSKSKAFLYLNELKIKKY
jgi:GTP-dependent phosphoenolpyruvate carboxykinase